MKLLHSIFEFKGNIPSVCGLRIGESYDDYYDLLSSIQDKRTGDFTLDYLLDEYSVFIDITRIDDDRIAEIKLHFFPFQPFSLSKMDKVTSYFKQFFDYTNHKVNISEDDNDFEYDCVLSNERHSISIQKNYCDPIVEILISSRIDELSKLQGANIYYYHEPLGIYGVKGSQLSLSITHHPGVLTREDVIENLMTAMRLDNEYGNDWHFAYEYNFLHKAGMIMPLDDESLLENEKFMRRHAEEMTDVWDWKGDMAQYILNMAREGEQLVPIEEICKDDLLSGEITDLEEHLEEMSDEWTLAQLLPYASLDY